MKKNEPLTMAQRLQAYIETLKSESKYLQTNEDHRYNDRVISKLKDIVRRG